MCALKLLANSKQCHNFAYRTELGVCKHDLDKIERDLARVKEENERLRSDKSAMANGIEKGAREVLEAKDKEIDKLRDRVNVLEAEVDKLKAEKEALEKELEKVVRVKTFNTVTNHGINLYNL